MLNEHNPIAVRISKLQDKWIESLSVNRDARIIRWLIQSNDLPLVNAFYRLESSPYGKIDEVPIVMLTDFESSETFAYKLSQDWVNEYEKGLKQYPNLPWKEFSLFKERLSNMSDPNYQEDFLADLLISYQKFIPDPVRQKLLLGIVPRNISTYGELNKWLDLFLDKLSPDMGITLIDFTEGEVFSWLIQKRETEALSIKLCDMDMQGAYAELMQQGNPNNPDVQIRMLVLEMGKAAAKKDQKEIHRLGAKVINIGQISGDTNLWAYVYLIYAGFLFEFRDDQIIPLLDKAIAISKRSVCSDKSQNSAVLIPLYGFKASYYNFIKRYNEAFEWFIYQAEIALEQNNMYAAISACKSSIIIADRHSMKNKMISFLQKVLKIFFALEDDILKMTEMYFLVSFFLKNSTDIATAEEQEMRMRMDMLFGKNWEKRSVTRFGIFSNPQTIMENAFS